MARRIIDLYYNTVKESLTNSSDAIINISQYPHIAYREQAMARIRLRGFNGTAATTYQGLTATERVNVAVDTVFAAGQMLFSNQSAVNVAGDWSESDLTNGKFSVRLDCTQATFLARLGSQSELVAHMEIQTAASGGTSPQGIFRFPIIVRNSIYTGGLS